MERRLSILANVQTSDGERHSARRGGDGDGPLHEAGPQQSTIVVAFRARPATRDLVRGLLG